MFLSPSSRPTLGHRSNLEPVPDHWKGTPITEQNGASSNRERKIRLGRPSAAKVTCELKKPSLLLYYLLLKAWRRAHPAVYPGCPRPCEFTPLRRGPFLSAPHSYHCTLLHSFSSKNILNKIMPVIHVHGETSEIHK